MAITEESPTETRRPPAPGILIDRMRYTSREFHELEMERMWSRTWQLACLASELRNAGDFSEYQIGPTSVIVLRASDSTLKAYHNVCQHRGRKIKSGQGCAQHLRCPYHGWTWDLDGRLADVPERETFCEFDDATVGLTSVRVDQWNDWVFINLDPNAPPLIEYLGEISGELAPFRYDRQYRWWNRTTTLKANWKNTTDAFLEAYHARQIHPESNSFLNYTDYEVRHLGDHSMMVIPTGVPDTVAVPYQPDYTDTLDAMEWSFAAFGEDTSAVAFLRQMQLQPGQRLRDLLLPVMAEGFKANGIDISALNESQMVDDWHYFIFPNIVINSFAFGYWLFRLRPYGNDPDQSIIDMWYFHRVPDAMEMPPPDPNQFIPEGESCGAVMDQDLRNLPNQQAGMHNPTFAGLRLSSLESRIGHLHDVLDRYLATP